MHQQSLQLNLLKLVQQQFNRVEKSQAQQLEFFSRAVSKAEDRYTAYLASSKVNSRSSCFGSF